MEAKHTPGPWHIEPTFNRVVSSRVIIATVDGNSETGKANANLIAAAPELLETIIAYRLHHKLMLNVSNDTDCPCKICQLAEAVIAKVNPH